MNGSKVTFEFCHIVSPVNTVLYVLNEKSQIYMYGCVLDGMTKSARFLSLTSDTDVKIINTYVKDFFSFCTVIDQTNILNKIRLQISSCYFEDVQDGVKMILHPASEVNIQVDKLKLEL